MGDAGIYIYCNRVYSIFNIFTIYARQINMLHLSENEKVLMVIHRHWIVIFWKFLIAFVLAIIPLIAAPVLLSNQSFNISDTAIPYIEFFLIVYLMIILLVSFILWSDYYLDIWIITSERIVDINQKGLFNREVSEFMLDKVQDVSVEVPNMLATMMKYGNLRIQTAGDRTFEIEEIPNLYEAKNLIMDYAKNQNNVGTQQVDSN